MLGRKVSLPKCISPSARRGSTAAPAGKAPDDRTDSFGETPTVLASTATGGLTPALSSPAKEGGAANSTAIKVVVRVRPLSERELLAKSPVVVNVTKSAVQVVNPALFTDPTFLDAISTATTKYSATNVPVALTAQAIAAANQAGECRSFHFDRCFGVDNAAANVSEPFANAYDIDTATQRPNQELVFEEIGREIIPSTFQGFNCTVFAYGQTGSGKTHTMVGEKSTTRGKGVIPRVCEALFQGIDARRAKENDLAVEVETAATMAVETGAPPPAPSSAVKKTVFAVQMSYCEIYKEKVHDLLDSSSSPSLTPTSSFSVSGTTTMSEGGAIPTSPVGSAANRGKVLKVREHPITGPFVEGLSTRLVNSYEDIADEILAGDKLRTVAATLMNPVSSRSHAMFTLTLTQTTFDAVTNIPTVKTSKIAMIDLAGSERANVSGTSGDRLKEGAMINKSLTTLGRVISALSKSNASSERVPYRDSTLTWLLKESLGGNAKTTMIAMVSPAAENYDETMSTLRYAESAKKVMNRAVVNEDPNARVIRQLRDEIQQLKDQLTRRETEAFYLVENLKEKTELPASVQDRDGFYREMQDEMVSYKTQVEALLQKQADQEEQLKKASRVVRLHTEFPSLLNVKPTSSLSSSDVVVCTLREGVCVVGSEEPTSGIVLEGVTADLAEPGDADISLSPHRLPRSTSWAGSLLKRRKSSSAGPSPAAESADTLDAKDEVGSSSPRKQSLTRRTSRNLTSDGTTEEVTSFLRLTSSGGDIRDNQEYVLAKHAVIMVRSRKPLDLQDTLDDQVEIEYVIDIQPLSADAAVFVNNNRMAADVRTRVRHGDIVGFGSEHEFCVHVPQIAETMKSMAPPTFVSEQRTEAREVEEHASPDALVAEANALCERWNFLMEFAVTTTSPEDIKDGGEAPCPRVLVKKRMGDKRFVIFQWSQEMLQEKLMLLRQIVTSFELVPDDSNAIESAPEEVEELIDDLGSSSRKVSSARNADHVNRLSESEASVNDDSRSTQTRMIPASMSLDGRYSTTLDTTAHPHVTSTVAPLSLPPQSLSVRLLGHMRIYFSGLGLEKDPQAFREVTLNVAAYDTAGRQIARMLCQLKSMPGDSIAATSDRGDTEVSGGSMLKRGLSYLSPRNSQTAATNKGLNYQSNRMVPTRLKVTIERVEFLSSASVPEQLSLTLKKWSSQRGASDDASSLAGAVESTSKIVVRDASSDLPVPSVFNHVTHVTVPVIVNGPPCEEFLGVEMWGYGEMSSSRLPAALPPPKPHKIELFVSVDIEERDADGFFRPVAVKSDGTLRLHINQPRRVSLRITQADHGPLVLHEFAIARLSPAFSTRGASNLAIGDGKSVQSLLLPPATNGVNTARSAATTEVDELPTFKDWHRLFPRSAAELDVASRSLTVSLRWERNTTDSVEAGEMEDGGDSRSVFRFAVAFKTTLSDVPIVISKSVVTKLSTTDVSSSQRLAREWESSRTAWWARESYSRNYRLGTWYSIDVTQQPRDVDYEAHDVHIESEEHNPEEEDAILEPPTVVAAINAHINGLRRLELCFSLERVRQEILVKYLCSRISDEYPLTLERAQECFENLLAITDEADDATVSPPVIKVLLLDDGAIYLRHKASKEVFIAIETGDVTAPPGSSQAESLTSGTEHVTHFVSEPSSLAGDATTSSGGEMCGFLMFSTSIQLDESAVAGIVSPSSPSGATSGGSNPLSWARNSLTNRLSWERRWFVLKRPFLYAYKSFARKEQIGVLDVVRCQLVVPSSSASSSTSRRPSLPGIVSRRGSKPDTPGGAFPFCFQLVSLTGGKCIVWSLQASTQAELRAWLVAIDPLKIDAREAVVTSNAAQTEPEGAAVATA